MHSAVKLLPDLSVSWRVLYRACNNSSSLISPAQQSSVRVRFAPSPTGLLHLGGFRTALYNHFYALQHNGSFILRIEDTDQNRVIPEATAQIEEILTWSGIKINEGPSHPTRYGPYIQSQRLALYHEVAERLLVSGHAYRCFCTPERLSLLKFTNKEFSAIRKGYDNKCRSLTPPEIATYMAEGRPFVIRFRYDLSSRKFEDDVFGHVEMGAGNYEGDPILMKSDNFPTYHLANVVDDHLMQISHVIRGEEWLASTSKHTQMYDALRWSRPRFAHLPLLMHPSGGKLSKRKGDSSLFLESLRADGIFPDVLQNFVCRYGGGFAGLDREFNTISSSEDLARMFDLTAINRHGCKIDLDLLSVLNSNFLCAKRLDSTLTSILRDRILQEHPKTTSDLSDANLGRILDKVTQDKRIHSLAFLTGPEYAFIWGHVVAQVHLYSAIIPVSSASQLFADIYSSLTQDGGPITDKTSIHELCSRLAQKYNLRGRPDVYRLIRIGITGRSGPGLPIIEMLQLLGIDQFARRMQMVSQQLKSAEVCSSQI